LAKDYLRFISENETDKVIAVGHSVGAINILRAAFLEPNKFRAIVLIEPVLFPPTFILLWNLVRLTGLGRTLHPMIPAALKRRRKFDNLEMVFRGYRGRKIFRNFSDESLNAYIRGITRPSPDHGYELIYSPEWEAHIYHTGVWRDLEIWRGLKKLKVPSLFIQGADTDTFKDKSARRVNKITPGVRVEKIYNAGHLVPLERPGEVANLILSFSKELS
jgi:pimeloyl-ACP methyl ester carboxylesterase